MKYPITHDKDNGLELAIANWTATGRAIHVYPRKYRISLNGFRPVSYAEAYQRMVDFLESNNI